MFTGIVTTVGSIRAVRGNGVLAVDVVAPGVAGALERGGSVAVNGVCLTATRVRRRRFSVEVVPETQRRTTLGALRRGASVNIELPARPQDRLGGHLVQGHVDGVVVVEAVTEDGGARRVRWRAGSDVLRHIAPRGSVAVDGVSLTVASVARQTFDVALIPHTLGVTTLGRLRPGHRANLETDVIAKYVDRLTSLAAPEPSS